MGCNIVLSFATRKAQKVNQLASVKQKKMNLLPFTRSTHSRPAKDSLLVAVIIDYVQRTSDPSEIRDTSHASRVASDAKGLSIAH